MFPSVLSCIQSFSIASCHASALSGVRLQLRAFTRLEYLDCALRARESPAVGTDVRMYFVHMALGTRKWAVMSFNQPSMNDFMIHFITIHFILRVGAGGPFH